MAYVKFLICNVAAWEKSSNLSCFSRSTLRHKIDYTTYQYVCLVGFFKILFCQKFKNNR